MRSLESDPYGDVQIPSSMATPPGITHGDYLL